MSRTHGPTANGSSEAEAYANGLVPVAPGEAERKANEALTFQDQRLNRARGDAVR